MGELLAFYALIPQLYNPIVRLTQFNITFATTQVAVDRVTEVLDEPETVMDRPSACPILRARGQVAFQNVSFAYGPDGRFLQTYSSLSNKLSIHVWAAPPNGAAGIMPGRPAIMFMFAGIRLLASAPELPERPGSAGEKALTM